MDRQRDFKLISYSIDLDGNVIRNIKTKVSFEILQKL